MIRISGTAWDTIRAHAESAYPEECCGALLGEREGAVKKVEIAMPVPNSAGARTTRYELQPEDLLAATAAARQRGLRLIGIYHSHPDYPPSFSDTDLANCWPWYVFVVVSVCRGRLDHAACWIPDPSGSRAEPEELIVEGPDGEG